MHNIHNIICDKAGEADNKTVNLFSKQKPRPTLIYILSCFLAMRSFDVREVGTHLADKIHLIYLSDGPSVTGSTV